VSETDPKRLMSFSPKVEERIEEQRRVEMTAAWSNLLDAFMLASATEVLPLEELHFLGQLVIGGRKYPAMVNIQPYFCTDDKPRELIIEVTEIHDEETEGAPIGKCMALFEWSKDEYRVEDFDSDEMFIAEELVDSKKIVDCAIGIIQQVAADEGGADLPRDIVFARLGKLLPSPTQPN
jgi:hypothetical protein